MRQDLESEPEIFNQSFIESHVNKDCLRRDLHSDIYDTNYEWLRNEANTKPVRFIQDNSLDFPEPTEKQLRAYADAMSDEENSAKDIYTNLEKMGDAEDRWIEMGEEPEVPDSEVEKVAEGETENQLEDPVSYLQDIYGKEDGIKKAIEIGGIDVDAAAEALIKGDGAEHFIALYDGNINDGPGGIVYWRDN